jgi:hypothetical protein
MECDGRIPEDAKGSLPPVFPTTEQVRARGFYFECD